MKNKGKIKGSIKLISHRLRLMVASLIVAIIALPGMAAAEAVNFTSVVDILTSVVDIFPPIVLIIIAVVPVLIIVAIVSFVMGLFGSILEGITGAMRELR